MMPRMLLVLPKRLLSEAGVWSEMLIFHEREIDSACGTQVFFF